MNLKMNVMLKKKNWLSSRIYVLKQKHNLKRLSKVYKMEEILMEKRCNMQKVDYVFSTIKNENLTKIEKQHQLRILPILAT